MMSRDEIRERFNFTTLLDPELQWKKVPSLAVYVHVPFCTNRCSYCDFYFEPTVGRSIQGRYLSSLDKEMDFWGSILEMDRIPSLYLGGGTPSTLGPDGLGCIIQRVKTTWPKAVPSIKEITVEANPEQLTEHFLTSCWELGINRISLGVQSLRDSTLALMGRRARYEDISRSLDLTEKYWPGKLSVDFITGLPGQTKMTTRSEVRELRSRGIDHFSVYTLQVEPGTVLYERASRDQLALDPQDQEDGWRWTHDELVESGLQWYEISNFGTQDSQSTHNLMYWNQEPYLGLGPGAVGTLENDRGWMRITNAHLFQYKGGENSPRHWEKLSPVQRFFELFFLGMRTQQGVPLQSIEKYLSENKDGSWRTGLERWYQQCARELERVEYSGLSFLRLKGLSRRRLNHYLGLLSEELSL